MTALLFSLSAFASPCETVFTTREMQEIVSRAKGAIEEGDRAEHLRASELLQERIPCIEGQIPTKEWADYLVTEALIKYLEKAPGWEKALKVALKLDPYHPDVQSFILDDYLEPPDPPGDTLPIPAGYVVFIDGAVLSGHIPPLDGLHVAQVLRGGVWTSKMLRGESFPKNWMGAEPEIPKPTVKQRPAYRFPSWGSIDLYGGISGWGQTEVNGTPVIVPKSSVGVYAGLASHGQRFAHKVVGVFWWGNFTMQRSTLFDNSNGVVPFGDFMAGLSLLDKPISVWLGGGVYTVRVRERRGERPFVVGNYLVGVSFRSSGPLPVDAVVGGGIFLHSYLIQAEAGVSIFEFGPGRLRLGLRLAQRQVMLGDGGLKQGDRDDLVRASRYTAGFTAGFAWGKD